jgi:hypothetical protein
MANEGGHKMGDRRGGSRPKERHKSWVAQVHQSHVLNRYGSRQFRRVLRTPSCNTALDSLVGRE